MAAQKRISVGLTHILLSNPNPKRHSFRVTFLPSAIETGNTGIIFIGKGFPPSATLGDPNQGDPLNAASEISDIEAFAGDPTVFKGAWWAISDTAGQIVIVDEM